MRRRTPPSACRRWRCRPAERRRFCLEDADLIALGRQALLIEEHYGRPMDIEWGKDGESGAIFILQARPETVQSRAGRTIQRYALKAPLARAGHRAQHRPAHRRRARARHPRRERDGARAGGDVLVADMTDPDWEPVMKRAAAIVTNRGGRTCHAAIIARELGIPAVVGCGDATQRIREGQEVTVSCAEGDTGYVYEGLLRVRAPADRARFAAEDPGEDHDERRQSGSRLRLRRHSQPRRRAWRGSSSSSTA